MEKIYVFGHRKPDTDSVSAAISYSYLKKQLGFNVCLLYTSDAADEL